MLLCFYPLDRIPAADQVSHLLHAIFYRQINPGNDYFRLIRSRKLISRLLYKSHQIIFFKTTKFCPYFMCTLPAIKQQQRLRQIWRNHSCFFRQKTHLLTKLLCINRVFLSVVSHYRIHQNLHILSPKQCYKRQNLIRLCRIRKKPRIDSVWLKVKFLPFIHNLIHTVCIIITKIGRKTCLAAQHCSRQRTCLDSHHRDHRNCRCKRTFSQS